MKSIRTDPLNHAAEGDERIRTAEQWLGANPVYDAHCGLNADVAQNTATDATSSASGGQARAGRSGENRERGPAQQRDSGFGRGGSEPPSALSRAEATDADRPAVPAPSTEPAPRYVEWASALASEDRKENVDA